MNNQEKIKTRKIIVNRIKGVFEYSDEFYKKYKETYKHDMNPLVLHRAGTSTPLHSPEMNILDQDNIINFRSDPKIIKIFEILGHYKSSCILSDLKIVYVPEELIAYIELNTKDGCDYLKINYDKAYTKLLFDIINDNELVENHKNKVNRIKYIQKNFSKKRSDLLEFIN